ncbi:glycosyltransferase family 39 protein [Aquiluna sp.]|nr:glycosyltransferase family 39 protein [Aquiluna sp.]
MNKFIAPSLLVAVAIVTWTRVRDINPSILGDEWVYLVSSRMTGMWDGGNTFLGNYLFNATHKLTLLCGESFYSCAKAINLAFFLIFVVFVYMVARLLITELSAYLVLVATGLSPLSIYVSLYLPESLYFACIGGAVYFLARVLVEDRSIFWLISGGWLGLAALAKPHSFLSLIGVLVFLLVSALFNKGSFGSRVNPLLLFTSGFLIIRLAAGFILGGPSSLNFLNSYGADGAIQQVIEGQDTAAIPSDGLVGAGQLQGAVGLFSAQLAVHALVLAAIIGIAIAVLIVNLFSLRRREQSLPLDRFALLVLIWLGVMVVAIVLFTGWVTGAGDDHTDRVLLRYYDFLFPFVFVAAIGLSEQSRFSSTKLYSRWISAGLVFTGLSIAFTGAFSSLEVQIADAPYLAGLVVDRFTYDAVAIIGTVGLLLLAFFPAYLKYVLVAAIVSTFPLMGIQIANQYELSRGAPNSADEIGKVAYNLLDPEDLNNTVVIAQSRFDGRTISFWMDADNELLLLEAGSVVTAENLPEEVAYIILDKAFEYSGGHSVIAENEIYSLILPDG